MDGIQIRNAARPLWRSHLAARGFPLSPETRVWYANAPTVLALAAAAQLATFNANMADWAINDLVEVGSDR